MALHGFKRHLRWSDFSKTSKSKDGEHDASTQTEIAFRCRFVTNPRNGEWHMTKVSVTLHMNHTNSWVVAAVAADADSKSSKQLLKHEQMHYDIAAIAARQLEGKLTQLRGNSSEKPDDRIRSVVEEIIGDQDAAGQITVDGLLQRVQHRYDEDISCGSNHGVDRPHQITWEHRVIRAHANRKAVLEELDSCPRPRAGAAAAGD
jgi:predicted secreted Zn-dependent protease